METKTSKFEVEKRLLKHAFHIEILETCQIRVKKMKEIIKFRKNYPKLQDDNFTTIRENSTLKRGDEVLIKTPLQQFRAEITSIHDVKLFDIPTYTLLEDTGTAHSTEALHELRQYYPNLTWNSYVYLIGIEKKSLK